MSEKLFDLVTFKRHWAVAGLFYIGIGLILLAITPGQPTTLATDGCGGCPEGQVCVQVGETYQCMCPGE